MTWLIIFQQIMMMVRVRGGETHQMDNNEKIDSRMKLLLVSAMSGLG